MSRTRFKFYLSCVFYFARLYLYVVFQAVAELPECLKEREIHPEFPLQKPSTVGSAVSFHSPAKMM